jgi:predicted nuclease with TOPRIM domain
MLSTLRNGSTQTGQQISKLETQNADLERQLSLAQSQERTTKASLKTAESRNKALREELTRLKASVTQIRSQCANEVRKRDNEMKRLQKYLEVKRGREGSTPVGVTVITPGVTKPAAIQSGSLGSASTESSAYSLKEETTEFLTHLSQNLSDENDALINLIQMTLATLRSLQGLPEASNFALDDNGALVEDSNIVNNAPPSYETLATDMDDVLEHLRSLLTNPSFVPLEEVQVREDEIIRLREGFERMEAKLKEALGLMKTWRKRMMESGDTADLEDLRRGLNLDASSLSKSTYAAINEAPRDTEAELESFIDEEFKLECELAANNESPVKPKRDSLFPAPEILRSTSGNVRRSPSARKVSFHANSPKIGALMDTLEDSDDIALIEAEAQPTDENGEMEMTVAQKLDKARKDAELAADTKKSVAPAVKRSAIPKKTRTKRRSTLSPEELEGLMGM